MMQNYPKMRLKDPSQTLEILRSSQNFTPTFRFPCSIETQNNEQFSQHMESLQPQHKINCCDITGPNEIRGFE